MSTLPQRYDDEIDLTESPNDDAVAMATEEDAIAVSSDKGDEDEDVKPNIKVS